MPNTHPPVPDTVTIVAYEDPLVDAHGHHPASAYVDWCWAPVIGPSSLLLYRRLAVLLDAHRIPERPETAMTTFPAKRPPRS